VGIAASMASVMLAGGASGKRYAMPNARIMIHQTSGGYRGNVADARIYLEEMNRQNDTIINLLAERTGKHPDQIRRDADRDCWLSADDARIYGLIDKITNGR